MPERDSFTYDNTNINSVYCIASEDSAS